jgi:hypothetical protein
MKDQINIRDRLIREHEVIQEVVSQIQKLSEEFMSLAEVHKHSADITSNQIGFLNAKRINFRHNLVSLRDGLRLHYQLVEEVIHQSISESILQRLIVQHERILKKIGEFDGVILNLSPLGVVFNSSYLKHMVDNLDLIISKLSYQEDSLLAITGACRDELVTAGQ